MEDPLILLGREMAGFAVLVGETEGDEPEVAGDGISEVVRVYGHRMTARGQRPDVRAPHR
ncbi:hypothetical protein [Aeromicrobium duanguangcaii]|uniref:Uncharacterized protein n=1 Tax=Aeromicrobium duanguangcaii TaxID=2968086 RepID=A0ABY5KES0_9ACTN|nr:hypothetical protein [Aeromicrobium duanguangcaii]MCD9153966.1 hypothetical protein [Aeromicrobium duanguangcaii]MCL3837701.1 hypothetical protein [Aeromicrobium duanguangcaii]UUI68956.1 hypothetical protein NP095_02280 [Aeromicrobium duanguangcaii]